MIEILNSALSKCLLAGAVVIVLGYLLLRSYPVRTDDIEDPTQDFWD